MSKDAEGLPQVTRGGHVSEHLANERTHLAYLRTAVSVISLGIAINRFAIYLSQTEPERIKARDGLVGVPSLGVGLVVFGMLLMVWAVVRYWQTGTQIDREEYRPNGVMIGLITAGVLALGTFALVWLFWR